MADPRQEGRSTAGRRRIIGICAAVLLVWGVVVLVVGLRSFEDAVPLVAPDPLPAGVVEDDLPASAEFQCAAPFEADRSPTESAQATEALSVQTLKREPCAEARQQRQILYSLDLALAAAGLVACAVLARRPRREVEQVPLTPVETNA